MGENVKNPSKVQPCSQGSLLPVPTERVGERTWERGCQRFGKTSNRVKKKEILTNGDNKKMANFGRKRAISAKMASMSSSFSQILK